MSLFYFVEAACSVEEKYSLSADQKAVIINTPPNEPKLNPGYILEYIGHV